jgi:hypothetical protein
VYEHERMQLDFLSYAIHKNKLNVLRPEAISEGKQGELCFDIGLGTGF